MTMRLCVGWLAGWAEDADADVTTMRKPASTANACLRWVMCLPLPD
jgi:hypothetical protein